MLPPSGTKHVMLNMLVFSQTKSENNLHLGLVKMTGFSTKANHRRDDRLVPG